MIVRQRELLIERWQSLALAESRNGDHPVVNLPEGSYTMSVELLERCYLLYAISDFSRVPDPAQVAAYPLQYLSELFRFAQGVKFFRDASARPPDML